MKTKLAEFLMIDEDDLQIGTKSLIAAVVVTPIVFKIVMAPFGWWL